MEFYSADVLNAHRSVMGLGSCYVDCSDLGNLPFQSSVDQALMGFESSFNFQEQHRPSDHEVDEEQSICTPTTELSPFSSHNRQEVNQKHQIHFQTQRHSGWQSFRSNSSSFEDDQNQVPLSPTEMAAMRSSPPCITHSSDLYFNSSPLYRYSQAGPGPIPPYAQSVSMPSYTDSASLPPYSEPPLSIVLSQSPTLLRNGSATSDFSNPPSVNSTGVNPIHVNPLSQPMTPPDDIFAPINDPFHQSWWGNQNHHSNVESLVNSARTSLDPCIQNSTDADVGVGISSIFSQPLNLSTSSPTALKSSTNSSSPYSIPSQAKPPPSPSFHIPLKTRRTSHRSNLSNHQRNTASKISNRPFLIEPDYSRLPTKRSRGRRPPISPDLGLPIPDGHLSIGLQSVPGGQAFDPNLNPNAETVKYCELTKTGKPKKIFICQVKGCGKCFKRSEHLKRHVRSIHTNDKPYNCPWMACMKSFSRHDNLNQHLRVHRVEEGGEVLNGLHIGSDGILRSDLDESPVDPIFRGLRNVEVMDRFMIEE